MARALKGYYGRLGRIGVEMAWAMLPVARLRETADRFAIEWPVAVGLRRAAASLTPDAAGAGARADSAPSQTLLVEADGDRLGFGIFIVENLTTEPVSAPIRVSTFVDEHGREVRPRLMLKPASVSLGPGEQAMVQLAAELDQALEPGVRYRGEIAIPGLSDRRIPIVLRRRTADAPPTPAPAAPARRPQRRRPRTTPDQPQ